MNMFKDFLGKIKSIFKAEKSPTNVTVSFENQSKNVKKQKKLNNSVDNSTDNSTLTKTHAYHINFINFLLFS